MWWIADENEVLKDSLLKYIPKSQIEGWHTPFQRLSHNTVEEYRKKHYEMRSRIVKEMHEAGVHILAGTDTGSPFSLPGFSLHNELQALVDAGLSNIEALRAATVSPVKLLGREKDLGSIEKGKIADLVLLDANPLENISNTKKINAVIVNGKLLKRTDLNAMLKQVKQLAAK
jgi:imidazolonepropionase-like amidohydrolase